MDLKDVGLSILNYAPTLGGILGSVIPGAGTAAGTMAGTAIKVLAGMFGIKSPDPKPEELAAAIQADPQAAAKLLAAENEYKLEVAKMQHEESMAKIDSALDELRLGFADVMGARGRQIEHEKVTGKSDINLYILAWVIIAGFFGIIYALMVKAIPEDTQSVLFMMLGTLGAGFGAVIQFFFGKTKDTAANTQMLANSIPLSTHLQLLQQASAAPKLLTDGNGKTNGKEDSKRP